METIEIELKNAFNSKNIKSSTIFVYLTSFKRIIREVFKEKIPQLNEINNNENRKILIEYIKSDKVTMSSKKTILNGWIKCLSALKINIEELQIEFKKIARITNEYRDYTKPTEEELKNKISYKNIIIKRDLYKHLLKPEFQKEDLYYVILCLYTYLPPLRGEDFYNTLLVYNSDELSSEIKKTKNFLCLKEKIIVLNSYKTFDIYGIRQFSIPEELINTLLNFKNKSKFKWVICSSKGTKLDHANFYRLMTEAFGKKIGSSMLRKIYISSEIIDKNMTANERKKISYIMGHSVEQQQLTYSKFSKRLHPEENGNYNSSD
jgi:hypothetical protein